MSNPDTTCAPDDIDVLAAQRLFTHVMADRVGSRDLSGNAYLAASVYIALEKAGIACEMSAISASATASNNHQRIMSVWAIEVKGHYLDNAGNTRLEESQEYARQLVRDWMQTEYQEVPAKYTEEVYVERSNFQGERPSLGNADKEQAIFGKLRAEIMAERMHNALDEDVARTGPPRPRM